MGFLNNSQLVKNIAIFKGGWAVLDILCRLINSFIHSLINWLKKNQSVSGVPYYISSSCYVLNNLKIKVMYWHFKLRRFWLIVHFLHRINAGQLVVFESYSGKSYRGDCGCSAGYNQNYWPEDGKCYEWYSQVQWYKNLCRGHFKNSHYLLFTN